MEFLMYRFGLIALALLLLASCGRPGNKAPPALTPSILPASSATGQANSATPTVFLPVATRMEPGLTVEQKRRAEQLTSLFENGRIELQYSYAEDLGDGRGITTGRAGFTTADGDALEVVTLYT